MSNDPNSDDFYEEDEPVEKVVAAFEQGEKHLTVRPVRKLNHVDETQVWVIRSMSRVLGLSNAEIGRRFNLSRETVRDIVNRKTWRNI